MGGKSSSSSSSNTTTTQVDNRLVVGDDAALVIGPDAELSNVVLTDHGAIEGARDFVNTAGERLFTFAGDLVERTTDIVKEKSEDDLKEISSSLIKFSLLSTVAIGVIAIMLGRK